MDLLEELYAWAGQERFQARHTWRHGDTVIWDNRCCWHSASGENRSANRVAFTAPPLPTGPIEGLR